MKYFFLLIIAIILFIVVVPLATTYTFFYYRFRETESRKKYYYRIAYTIDVLANVMSGECFEAILCKKRKEDTLFCKPNYSISEAIGKEIFESNFNYRYNWFLKLLDSAFSETDHCLNSYLNTKR